VIVFDANVLIGFLDASDPQHAASKSLIERRFGDGFATSVLTVAEALVYPTRATRADAALASFARIGMRIIGIEDGDAPALARMRSNYRLRLPDAVALYTAASTGADLATFDDSLAAAAELAGVRVAR
jgi:predicted nucleic acid-binding protein